MFYLCSCDSEVFISDSVASVSAIQDFVIQHLKESFSKKKKNIKSESLTRSLLVFAVCLVIQGYSEHFRSLF